MTSLKPLTGLRVRVYLVATVLGSVFVVLLGRTTAIHATSISTRHAHGADSAIRRADIVDRHGDILATSLETWSLYANPRRIFDAGDVVRAVHGVLPTIDRARLIGRLSDRDRAFVWIKRGLTPRQRRKVFDLGLEGLGFRREYKRVYPGGDLARHVLGAVDPDGQGISGLELVHDTKLRSGKSPLRLTIDAPVQAALEAQIAATGIRTGAAGVGGVVVRTQSGAIVALASWAGGTMSGAGDLNRIAGAVHELGSVFKPITAAAALDADVISGTDTMDVSEPVSIGSKVITTIGHGLDNAQAATLQDVIVHSSNTGIVGVAERLGPDQLGEFFDRIGLLDRPDINFPGVARPLVPSNWDRLTTSTASFGHGLAVSPLSLVLAYAIIANRGRLVRPHLVVPGAFAAVQGKKIMDGEDADAIVSMLRAVVTDGTGRQARAEGYAVAGKTGTAEKPGPDGYRKNANVCSFVAVFPYPTPEYAALIVVDEPRGKKRSASVTAAPAMARLIERIAPLLGVRPQTDQLHAGVGKG